MPDNLHEQAETVHDWVSSYNWDDGFAAIWPIVESDKTEFATALLIYWRLDGPWFCRDRETEAGKLHASVEKRLLEGFYPKGALRYEPIMDVGLSKLQVAKLMKDGFPVGLLVPKYGENNP